VPIEGVVHALRNLHEALTPGGTLVDTQPLSASPLVASDDVELGRLDMLDWIGTIDDVDSRVAQVVEDGLFEIHDERVFVVTDSFDDGRQCLTTIATWCDTRVPPPLARRLDAAHGAVTVEQDVRLRLFRSTSPPQ